MSDDTKAADTTETDENGEAVETDVEAVDPIQHFDSSVMKTLPDGSTVLSSYVDTSLGEKLSADADAEAQAAADAQAVADAEAEEDTAAEEDAAPAPVPAPVPVPEPAPAPTVAESKFGKSPDAQADPS